VGGKALRLLTLLSLRRLILTSLDLLLVALATFLALLLRENFNLVESKVIAVIPYVSFCLVSASAVFFVAGLDRTPWRYSSVTDQVQIVVLTVLVILLALLLTFTANRLDGVSRSLPVLQGILIVSTLVSARVTARFWFARQKRVSSDGPGNRHLHETVLVVGVNAVSELFLRCVREFASQQIEIAGVIAEEPMMRGRTVQQKPILGTIQELPNILQSLEVHGVGVDKIVVAIPADRLLAEAREALLELEKSSDIAVQFLSERLGLDGPSQMSSVRSDRERGAVCGQKSLVVVGAVDHVGSVRSFSILKRMIDGCAAACLLVALAPISALVALVVALDVGFPLIFWQQRPGLFGRPFKLYKFRTMRAPHDRHLRPIADDQRSSAVGRVLRRTRLDELPQLYNVLIGDMSLVGPRPLLPRDQSPDYAARLSVRPGITGWAQVNGGRIISPSDKWMLDIWYAQNMSLMLDLKILFGTVKMVSFGDRINVEAIKQARGDLDSNELGIEIVPAE
jgi:lipopolysaccharide/colanic/teichoic acid biosynthesis glycosyltransferase